MVKFSIYLEDYKTKGIDFVMKKYGTVQIKTKINNRYFKIIFWNELSNFDYAEYFEGRAA